MTAIALVGAGGSMGVRVIRALKDDPECRLACVEPGEAGKARRRGEEEGNSQPAH